MPGVEAIKHGREEAVDDFPFSYSARTTNLTSLKLIHSRASGGTNSQKRVEIASERVFYQGKAAEKANTSLRSADSISVLYSSFTGASIAATDLFCSSRLRSIRVGVAKIKEYAPTAVAEVSHGLNLDMAEQMAAVLAGGSLEGQALR